MIVTLFTASTKSNDETTLSWSAKAEAGKVRPRIRVVRSESRFGPYEPLTQWLDPFTVTEFIDTTTRMKIGRRWYYRLEIQDDNSTPQGPNAESRMYPAEDGVSDENREPEARMLATDSELRYRNDGEEVIYFPIRSHGARCTRCYDDRTGAQLTASCPACYGTSFAGGFMNPVKLFAMVEDVQAVDATNSPQGQSISMYRAKGRFPWYLDLKEGDVVVDEENRRWRVCRPQAIRKRRCITHWLCDLEMLSFDAVEYKLPVPDTIADKRRGWKYVPDFMR